MNRRKYFLTVILVIAMAAITVAAASAAAQDVLGTSRGPARLARLFGMRGLINQLNLTSDQKTQITSVLKNHKNQIIQAVRDVVQARLDLSKGVPESATELAKAQVQAANLRQQILNQIKPVLTADQLAKVQDRQQAKQQRLQRLLDRLNGKLGG